MQGCPFVTPIFDPLLAPRDYLQMVQVRVAAEQITVAVELPESLAEGRSFVQSLPTRERKLFYIYISMQG